MKSKVFVTAACAIGFIMMFSCKTVYVPVEKEVIRRDSIYRSVVYKDTVIERDTVKIKINGDCVDSIVTKWRERVRWRSDTVFVLTADTVYQDKIIQTVPKGYYKRKWYNDVLETLGGIALLALVIYLIIIAVKSRMRGVV